MKMDQCATRTICNEINFSRTQWHDVDDVLHQAIYLLAADARYFGSVAMQMDRMLFTLEHPSHPMVVTSGAFG